MTIDEAILWLKDNVEGELIYGLDNEEFKANVIEFNLVDNLIDYEISRRFPNDDMFFIDNYENRQEMILMEKERLTKEVYDKLNIFK